MVKSWPNTMTDKPTKLVSKWVVAFISFLFCPFFHLLNIFKLIVFYFLENILPLLFLTITEWKIFNDLVNLIMKFNFDLFWCQHRFFVSFKTIQWTLQDCLNLWFQLETLLHILFMISFPFIFETYFLWKNLEEHTHIFNIGFLTFNNLFITDFSLF